MEQEELKRKLMGLWEKTTHNSKDLLAILFEYYFDLRYLEYKENEGKIVSAVCGIPYTFGFGKHRLNGLYLMALSSEEGYRKKGVLSELLHNMNLKVENDFDFTFIVPNTELLEDYYGTQGYFSSFYILEERFTPFHDFKKDYILSLTDSHERSRDLKKALFDEIIVAENNEASIFSKEQIIKFIEEIEKKPASSVNLSHSATDLDYILREGTVRNLNSYIAYDSDGKITGVIFFQKEDLKRISVTAAYISDICSYFALLNHIKKQYGDHSLSVHTNDPKFQTLSIFQQTYASENPNGGDLNNTFSVVEIPFNINKLLHPMGMVRLLRYDRIIEYIAKTRKDVDFKLYIRDYGINENNPQSYEKMETERDYEALQEGLVLTDEQALKSPEEEKKVYIVRNGTCTVEPFESHKRDRSILVLSKKEVSELLLRKNDSSNLIMEAFGIPRLNLQYQLLPC